MHQSSVRLLLYTYSKCIIFQSVLIFLCNLRTKDCTKGTVCICNIYINASLLLFIDRCPNFLRRTFSSSVFSKFKVVYMLSDRRSLSVLFLHMDYSGSADKIKCYSFAAGSLSETLEDLYVLPFIDSVRTPRFAIYSLSSCAIKRMKFSTYSGFPRKRLRSSGFCVATPTGQVSRLQTRIITQPIVTSGAVAKPNSSAPRSAAMATSRPLISLPSVSMRTRLRRSIHDQCLVCLSKSKLPRKSGIMDRELLGAAPVPPSYPEIRITCAPAFATPAATVPTPASDTSFTEISAFCLHSSGHKSAVPDLQ